MDEDRLIAVLARIAVALETPHQHDPGMTALMEGIAAAQQQQIAQYKIASEANDANWLKSHETAEAARAEGEAHFQSCGETHERYFQGLDKLAARIKILEERAEPWQP